YMNLIRAQRQPGRSESSGLFVSPLRGSPTFWGTRSQRLRAGLKAVPPLAGLVSVVPALCDLGRSRSLAGPVTSRSLAGLRRSRSLAGLRNISLISGSRRSRSLAGLEDLAH